MKLRKLITTKSHKYGTRHMVAGDEYEVPPRHAIALVASKKAKFADDKPVRAPKPMAAPQPAPEPVEAEAATIEDLRQVAMQHGIAVDKRWGEPRLRHEVEIARAKR